MSGESVTGIEKRLLDALKGNGDWMTRLELGKAIGRPGKMYPYDVSKVEALAARGLVEISQRPRGLETIEIIYRAK